MGKRVDAERHVQVAQRPLLDFGQLTGCSVLCPRRDTRILYRAKIQTSNAGKPRSYAAIAVSMHSSRNN